MQLIYGSLTDRDWQDWLLLKHIDIYFQRILVNKRNIFCTSISYWPKIHSKMYSVYILHVLCVCVCVCIYTHHIIDINLYWLYSYFSYFLCRINKKKN